MLRQTAQNTSHIIPENVLYFAVNNSHVKIKPGRIIPWFDEIKFYLNDFPICKTDSLTDRKAPVRKRRARKK